jgi:RNA polymerase-binding transcription factor DksA
MNPQPAWRKLLLAKGAEVAGRLEALLSKKDVDLGDLPPPKRPDEDPELRLRRWLEQIDRAIKRWGTDRFGRCSQCGDPLDDQTLADQPWLDWCPRHPPG